VKTPRELRSAANEAESVTVTRNEYDDGMVVAVDFGPTAVAEHDVVGDTVIVVADDRQVEFELPSEASGVTTNNGVLTIRGRGEAADER
jgi:hypothetical protein